MSELKLAMGAKAPCEASPRWRLRLMGKRVQGTGTGTHDMKMKLYHGDCLEKMKLIPDKSVDMVLTDPPYGTTACKWDVVIPFKEMWQQVERVIKPKGAILIFGAEPFSSILRASNLKIFKYDWIWIKDKPVGFLNAKKMPLSCHEIISVFYKKPPLYVPQKWDSKPMNTVNFGGGVMSGNKIDIYGKRSVVLKKEKNSTKRLPLSYLKMNGVNGQSKDKTKHPTQKPVTLLEYLIKTYTLENETVLDFTAGSFSTGIACVNLNRHFIGIEKDREYFNIGVNRMKERIDCLDLKIELTIVEEN